MARSRTRFVLVYLLPFLHLCACITVGLMDLDSGLQYIGTADLPFSILLAPGPVGPAFLLPTLPSGNA